MYKNLIKSAFRHLVSQRVHSSINLLGLSTGLATCLLIYLFVNHELNYDSFHKNADTIFRIQAHFQNEGQESHWAASQGNLANEFSSRYPEVKASIRIAPDKLPIIFRNGDRQFKEEGVCHVDSLFLDVFDFPLIVGDKNTVLDEPENIIISESTAIKYFDTKDAIGKTLSTDRRNYEVKGVFEDVPEQSHIHFDMLIPMSDLRQIRPNIDSRGPSSFYTYVQLNNPESLPAIKEKTREDIYSIMGFNTGENNDISEGFNAYYSFNRIDKIHVSGNAEKEMETNSDIQYIYIFSAIALFVLLIAAFNYMNLATAQSLKRAKETGLRKVLGAGKSILFAQFMIEAILLALISAIASVFLVIFILPYFNLAIGKSFSMVDILDINTGLVLLVITVIIGLFAGSYPALVLSRFSPMKAIGANTASTKSGGVVRLRKVLVTVQFALSVLLVIAALTVKDQLLFIQNKNIGMDKDHIMVVPLPNRGGMENLETIKTQLLQINTVNSISASSTIPGKRVHIMSVGVPSLASQNPEEENDGFTGMRIMSGDDDMVNTFGLEIVEGRDFMQGSIADVEGGFILNEAAIEEFNLEDPIGKPFEYVYGLPEPKRGTIIGVVKDFNYASLHGTIEPLMMHIYPRYHAYMSIKIEGISVANTVENVKSS
jgi:putative ABC transport system permease protein